MDLVLVGIIINCTHGQCLFLNLRIDMKKTRLLFSVLYILTSAIACLSTGSEIEETLADFSASDLEGIWQADYSFPNGHGVEILTFNIEDNTYSQIFEDTGGYLYSGTGTWKVETDLNGRVFVRLNNALWFPLGSKQASLKGMDSSPDNLGKPHRYYDHQTNTFILMPDMILLEVIPRNTTKGFELFHFAWDIDSAPEHFEPIIK